MGLDTTEAARAIIRVANANMADAVRLISIRRGYDPREFALVVFGGAGALHGAALAKELSIPTVIVPPNPGITSALGCLLVDIRHDLARCTCGASRTRCRARSRRSSRSSRPRRASAWPPRACREDRMTFRRTIAMRYLGQWRSLGVAVDEGLESLDDVVARFHAEHEREYAYRREGAPVELYQLGLQAVGVTPKPELPATSSTASRAAGAADARPVVVRRAATRSTRRSTTAPRCPPACRLDGPGDRSSSSTRPRRAARRHAASTSS